MKITIQGRAGTVVLFSDEIAKFCKGDSSVQNLKGGGEGDNAKVKTYINIRDRFAADIVLMLRHSDEFKKFMREKYEANQKN